MSEDPKSPDNSPTENKQPASGPLAPLDAMLTRLTRGRIPVQWARYGGLAVLLVFALLIVAVMSNFVSGIQKAQQEELHATAMALALPRIEAVTGGEAGALMPSFGSAISPFTDGIPRLASMDTIIPSRSRGTMEDYTVVQGDTLFGIAEKFGIEAQSLLWFNFDVLEDNPAQIKPGQVLKIPPVDGVLHTYRTGESLASIVDFYSVSTNPTIQDVIEWPGNNMDPYEIDVNNPNIPDGTQLIIPNGSRELRDWGPPAVTRQNAAVAAYYGAGACGAIYEGAVGDGAFVWPTVATYLSGFDYNPPLHNGIDIAGAEGNAIFAADSGVVVYSGWSDHGYGNLLVIDHGTGFQTAYAHLLTISVSCGQSVTRGEVVAALGNSGNSSGPHLHFEINLSGYGKVNPWGYVAP
jgi:murein DD-endopeptidase MepM/ murein hydrolase activator NlpD